MKKSIPVFFCLLMFLTTSASTYKSKISDDWFVKATVYMEGKVAKVIKERIPKDVNVKQSIYNTTSLTWNNGKIIIPDSGFYWFVPFNNDPVFLLVGGETCYECGGWYVCSSGSCSWVSGSGGCEVCDCGSGQSNPCMVTQYPCNGSGGTQRIGGGIILAATNVEIVETYESRIKDEMYGKITVQYSNQVAYLSRVTSDESETQPGQIIFNATKIAWNDGRILIPLKGNFWFIPFDGMPSFLPNGGAWCYDCNNNGGSCNDASSCAFRDSGNGASQCKCQDGGSSSCSVTRCPCDESTNRIIGGGIILEANAVYYK